MKDAAPPTDSIPAPPPSTPPRDIPKKTAKTPSLASLLKGDSRPEAATTTNSAGETTLAEPYTDEQLRDVWNSFAGQRKKFQAEFQMLSQPFRKEGNTITVDLLSPVHETMLNNIKSELVGFLRERLRNNTIQVTGEVLTGEEKKVIYTNREKFDFLAEKNPMLKELKDRLGLDTDF